MLVDPERFGDQYEALLQVQRVSTEKVVEIFVSAGSCDSLCAAKILVVRRLRPVVKRVNAPVVPSSAPTPPRARTASA